MQGSQLFIKGMVQQIHKNIPTLSHWTPTQTSCGTWIIQWQSLEDIRKIYNYLYPLEGRYPFLLRKYSLLQKILGINE
jgi:hypothetical protein